MNPSVLIVDDNAGDREILEEVLEEAELKINLIHAQNAQDGIQLARSENPDLIIMDILMPGMSGGDAVKLLKTDKRTDHIPIVFLTGISSNNDKDGTGHINIDEQFYDSVAKPIDKDKLLSAVKKYV